MRRALYGYGAEIRANSRTMLWDAVCPRTTEAETTSTKTDTNLAPLWRMGLLSPKGMLGVGHFLDISRQACGLLIFMYNEGPPHQATMPRL